MNGWLILKEMLNPCLETFLTVAQCGSFTKAAARLYLSPTAVMKQINTLEKQLDLKLVERSSTGVVLTPAGRIIAQAGENLQKESQQALKKARAAQLSQEKIFRVGTSVLNPALPFMELWNTCCDAFPDYSIHLVPFEDDHQGILNEIAQLGVKYDFLIGVVNSRAWLSTCSFLQLGTWRKMIAVSRTHPLAVRKSLRIRDLEGQTLMMVPEGDSPVNDQIRHDLQKNHPGIQIVDTTTYYDMNVFNQAAAGQNLLLNTECWAGVHPELVTLPVEDWDYTIPWGLLYSRHPSPAVRRFVETVKKLQARP